MLTVEGLYEIGMGALKEVVAVLVVVLLGQFAVADVKTAKGQGLI